MKSKDAVELSVVIPCFNGVPWISEQLESLSKFPYRGAWELILVDNGSTDGTLPVLTAFAQLRAHCRVVIEESRGKAFALNRGVDEAVGEYVIFLDQDDQITDGFLDTMVHHLSEFDIVSGVRDFSLNGDLVVGLRGREGLVHIWLPGVSGGTLGARRDVALDVRFATDVGVGDDLDFSWRAQLAGFTLGLANDAIVDYRVRDTVRAAFRQGRSYGDCSVLLHRKFRTLGHPRRSIQDLAAELKTILYWVIQSRSSKAARLRAAQRTGALIGRLRACARERVWYI